VIHGLATIVGLLVGPLRAAAQDAPVEPAQTAAADSAESAGVVADSAEPASAGSAAQPLPPGVPTPLRLAPDVVHLRDGTRLRGTVAEYRSAGGVTLVLSSGEVRVLAPSDVARVVRLDASTPSRGSAGTPRASAPPVRVRFQPRGEGSLTVYVAAGVRARAAVRDDWLAQLSERWDEDPEPQGFQVFDLLCTAPCERTLDARDHQLGLGINGAPPVPAGRVSLRDSTRVLLSYESRQTQRTAGAVVVFASLLGLPTLGLMAVALGPDPTFQIAGFVSAVLSALVGAIVGILLSGTASDSATAATVEEP